MNEESKIREFILENFMAGQSDKDLENDNSLLESGIIDSMGMLELIAFAEGTYNIEVEDEEVIPDNFDSVNKLAAYIRKKANE